MPTKGDTKELNAFVVAYNNIGAIDLNKESKKRANLAVLIEEIYQNAATVKVRYQVFKEKSGKRNRDGTDPEQQASELLNVWNNYIQVMNDFEVSEHVLGPATAHIKTGLEVPKIFYIGDKKSTKAECEATPLPSFEPGQGPMDVQEEPRESDDYADKKRRSNSSDPNTGFYKQEERGGADPGSSEDSGSAGTDPGPSQKDPAGANPGSPEQENPTGADPGSSQANPAGANTGVSEQSHPSNDNQGGPATPMRGVSSSPSTTPGSNGTTPGRDISSSPHTTVSDVSTPRKSPGPDGLGSWEFVAGPDGTVQFKSPYPDVPEPPSGTNPKYPHIEYWRDLGGDRAHLAKVAERVTTTNESGEEIRLVRYTLKARSSIMNKDEFLQLKQTVKKFVTVDLTSLPPQIDDMKIFGFAETIKSPYRSFIGHKLNGEPVWCSEEDLNMKYTAMIAGDACQYARSKFPGYTKTEMLRPAIEPSPARPRAKLRPRNAYTVPPEDRALEFLRASPRVKRPRNAYTVPPEDRALESLRASPRVKLRPRNAIAPPEQRATRASSVNIDGRSTLPELMAAMKMIQRRLETIGPEEDDEEDDEEDEDS